MKWILMSAALMTAFTLACADADLDNDGVINELDYCENTAPNVKVDTHGCEPDDDRDGVVNSKDKCPDTPPGVKVDKDGCPLDSDGDGVADYRDKCPRTPTGIAVDANGCPLDSDQDGVLNPLDACPNTPLGYEVDEKGCATKFNMRTGFAYKSYELNDKGVQDIETLYDFMKRNRTAKVDIVGHTCNIGGDSYNMTLSENRALTVAESLKHKGIDPARISVAWKGLREPVASNDTEEGRSLNRRVEIKIFYSADDIAKEKLTP